MSYAIIYACLGMGTYFFIEAMDRIRWVIEMREYKRRQREQTEKAKNLVRNGKKSGG